MYDVKQIVALYYSQKNSHFAIFELFTALNLQPAAQTEHRRRSHMMSEYLVDVVDPWRKIYKKILSRQQLLVQQNKLNLTAISVA